MIDTIDFEGNSDANTKGTPRSLTELEKFGVKVALVLGAAVVLGKRADHALALHVVLAALPGALEVGLGAVDAGAHLLDLRVERAALRRLAHENR